MMGRKSDSYTTDSGSKPKFWLKVSLSVTWESGGREVQGVRGDLVGLGVLGREVRVVEVRGRCWVATRCICGRGVVRE